MRGIEGGLQALLAGLQLGLALGQLGRQGRGAREQLLHAHLGRLGSRDVAGDNDATDDSACLVAKGSEAVGAEPTLAGVLAAEGVDLVGGTLAAQSPRHRPTVHGGRFAAGQ